MEKITTGSFSPLLGADALAALENANKNSLNSNSYRSGYEHYMRRIIKIGSNDLIMAEKMDNFQRQMILLARELCNKQWIYDNWPNDGVMLNRTVLAIDEESGAEIVLARWNQIETPIHGHAPGMMMDYLISGAMYQTNYELSSPVNRKVVQYGYTTLHHDMETLLIDLDPVVITPYSAHIHKYVPLTRCVTLSFIPSHPRDGQNATFTLH